MEEKNKIKEIDLSVIIKKLLKRKKLYAIVLPIVFAVSCIFVLPIPRTYSCQIKLAPEESGGAGLGGSLNSLASSFGLDMTGKVRSGDAISPELYPDLFKSNDFLVSLFPIQVSSIDGEINNITYYEYLKTKQKCAWWQIPIIKLKEALSSDSNNRSNTSKGEKGEINPFMLSKDEFKIAEAISGNITCNVDKKNDVITMTVTAQDPLIAASVADSVRSKIQAFITEYRTQKARTDESYYKQLYSDSKRAYQKARQAYASYADSYQDLVLQSYKSQEEELENEMQIKFNIYQQITAQYQAAKAKVQEKTPAFTILQSASVPIKPSGPKRMIIIGVMLILAFIGTSIYILQKEKL